MILQSMDEWDFDDVNNTTYPVGTTSLVASQRDYSFPDSFKILSIKRVDVSWDGTTWYKAEPIDSAMQEIAFGNEATVDTNFITTQPAYDLKGNAIFLYPRPTASTGSLRVEYLREPAEFTSAEVTTGTKEPGFDAPFHMLIPLGVSYDWFVAKKQWNEATIIQQELTDYEMRLKKHYGDKDANSHMQLSAVTTDYN